MALNRIILWLGNSLAIIAFLMALTALFGLFLLEFSESMLFSILSSHDRVDQRHFHPDNAKHSRPGNQKPMRSHFY